MKLADMCSEYVVTCSNLEHNEFLGPSVTIVQKPDQDGFRLIDGRHITQFMVDDSDLSDEEVPGGSKLNVANRDTPGPDHWQVRTEVQSQRPQLLDEGDAQESDETVTGRKGPPILTWACLSPSFNKSIPARRLAAESLFTIMEDIDRELCQHKDLPYACVSEVTLAELTARLLDFKIQAQTKPKRSQSSHTPNIDLDPKLPKIADLPSLRNLDLEPSSPGDDILHSRLVAIHAVVDEITAVAQKFVGLFSPCTNEHPVLKKIWGSLLTLLTVCLSHYFHSGM